MTNDVKTFGLEPEPCWTGAALIAAQEDAACLRTELEEAKADLAEAKAKLAELREMERERNAWRHGFERLLGRCLGGVAVTRGTEGIETGVDKSSKAIERLRRKASLATQVLALSRAYEKKAP